MSIDSTIRQRLLGTRNSERHEYRCEICEMQFTSGRSPSVAACPGCGAVQLTEQ